MSNRPYAGVEIAAQTFAGQVAFLGDRPPKGATSMSAAFTQPADPLLSSVLAVLKVASERGFVVTRTKLAKMLYFADLEAVEDGGTQFSGATWRWRDFGPYDNALMRAENDLVAAELVDRHDDRFEYSYGACVLTLTVDIEDPLQPSNMTIIRRVVDEHGAKTATALRDLSYRTTPMIEAQAAGEREVVLDLSRVRRARQARALRERYRQRRSARAPQTDDPGVGEVLRAEVLATRAARLRANARMLGTE